MLKKLVIGAAALATLGGGLAASTSADAHGWGPGAAVGAGILGVAIGASLAQPHYAPAPVYYAPAPVYYAPPRYYAYEDCRVAWRWNPYWGRYVRVERCD